MMYCQHCKYAEKCEGEQWESCPFDGYGEVWDATDDFENVENEMFDQAVDFERSPIAAMVSLFTAISTVIGFSPLPS